ncbi:hypothetical protein IE4803_CH00309 [Rhizobium etli bv. phaseoli str. IE4803]|nr:hypothetical protein IE4803_CH00309 [Rhizobium etli bv. phaseoli str. IE4803]
MISEVYARKSRKRKAWSAAAFPKRDGGCAGEVEYLEQKKNATRKNRVETAAIP